MDGKRLRNWPFFAASYIKAIIYDNSGQFWTDYPESVNFSGVAGFSGARMAFPAIFGGFSGPVVSR